MAKKQTLQKMHTWLAEHDSHSIYDADMAAEAFRKATGKEPTWHGRRPDSIRAAIKARGLGGYYTSNKPGVAGFEMAESLAAKHCNFHSDKEGRGRRFWESIEALKQADL